MRDQIYNPYKTTKLRKELTSISEIVKPFPLGWDRDGNWSYDQCFQDCDDIKWKFFLSLCGTCVLHTLRADPECQIVIKPLGRLSLHQSNAAFKRCVDSYTSCWTKAGSLPQALLHTHKGMLKSEFQITCKWHFWPSTFVRIMTLKVNWLLVTMALEDEFNVPNPSVYSIVCKSIRTI